MEARRRGRANEKEEEKDKGESGENGVVGFKLGGFHFAIVLMCSLLLGGIFGFLPAVGSWF